MSTTARIAKQNPAAGRILSNTLALYFRQMLVMLVTLYTSRVVLKALGVEDFGIYSVVGGVVVFLNFFNSSLAVTTQRFLNYEMAGNNADSLRTVFSMALNIHCLIALLVFILAETIGLWFVRTKLVIPADRLYAALWVYQLSVFMMIVNVINVPYNAAIVAVERMNVYAYVSIIDVLLKLAVVYLLVHLSFDKLLIYGVSLLIVSLIVRLIYTLYCKRYFIWCRYKFVWNKSILKKMLGFSGWTVIGTGTEMLSIQGLAILINMFFGPVHNAAQAIAVQVQGAVRSFSLNLMTSARPQIVKSYSRGDHDNVFKLVFAASKFSYYLLFILSFPVLLKTNYILRLWLGNIPDYSIVFTRLVLIDALILALISPLAALSQASGKVRNYQLIISACYASVFIITAILYVLKFDSYMAFVVGIIMSMVGLITRIIEMKYSVGLPVKKLCGEVFARILLVTVIAVIVPLFFWSVLLSKNETLINFIITVLLTTVSTMISIWFAGLNKQEKKFVLNRFWRTNDAKIYF